MVSRVTFVRTVNILMLVMCVTIWAILLGIVLKEEEVLVVSWVLCSSRGRGMDLATNRSGVPRGNNSHISTRPPQFRVLRMRGERVLPFLLRLQGRGEGLFRIRKMFN